MRLPLYNWPVTRLLPLSLPPNTAGQEGSRESRVLVFGLEYSSVRVFECSSIKPASLHLFTSSSLWVFFTSIDSESRSETTRVQDFQNCETSMRDFDTSLRAFRVFDSSLYLHVFMFSPLYLFSSSNL